ncbi:MAG: sigma 54-interacting transcriptional regulator [Actinobacteria bacterium]|nr:sigma 54-interacting transcriptional regulator [Actinomycetota bacterium]
MSSPATLGELHDAGYPDRSVKDELRTNLVARLRASGPLFPGLVGYDDSVLPTLERAILAGHDVIILGERGQAKSRLIRRLTDLLDESVPVISGCEVNDHPFRPICRRCRDLVEEKRTATPVSWIGPELRFAEKLATPDTAVADLIGDVDPIRVAEGRYLGDELTIHYGLVPRTNRGIFAVNELPDLPERIQVSLLNILEERDVQVRGYKIRLPLDLMLIASANPEDYTHRGRIITPLKDRFGSQIRTHYPQRIEHEIAIMDQEATPPPPGLPVKVPVHLKETIAAFTAALRLSPQVNQKSGVSVRFSIGALEMLSASALRRALRGDEHEAVPRAVDLWSILPAATGRIEFDSLEEGREPEIMSRALRKAIMEVWRRRLGGENFTALLDRFDNGLVAETSDLMGATDFLAQFELGETTGWGALPGVGRFTTRLGFGEESPEAVASALEFTLEGLYLAKRINKEETGAPGSWRFGEAA